MGKNQIALNIFIFFLCAVLGWKTSVLAAEVRKIQIAEKPVPLNELIDRFSAEIAGEMKQNDTNRAGMLEFTLYDSSGYRTMARNEYLSFPIFCSSRLERKINTKLNDNTFKVLSSETTQKAFKEAGLTPSSLFTSKSKKIIKEITINGKPITCLIVGTIIGLEGKNLTLQCGVWDILRMKATVVVTGIAALASNELGFFQDWLPNGFLAENSLQASAEEDVTEENIRPSESRPKQEKQDLTGKKKEKTLQSVFSPDFPFPVDIQVKNNSTNRYESRPMEIINGQLYIPFQLGEVYQIVIKNRTESQVGLRLFVDGLNTHPEKIDGETIIGARVGLDEGRFWILRPTRPTSKDPFAEGAKIRGFYEKIGNSGSLREFQITAVSNSLAAVREFTENVGDITLAFYSFQEEPVEATKGIDPVATGLGQRVQDRDIKIISGRKIDRPLSIYHIRYATPDAIALLKK
jgi:hypothetical protein